MSEVESAEPCVVACKAQAQDALRRDDDAATLVSNLEKKSKFLNQGAQPRSTPKQYLEDTHLIILGKQLACERAAVPPVEQGKKHAGMHSAGGFSNKGRIGTAS